MLMKPKRRHYLAMSHSLLKPLFCALCVKDDSSAPGIGAPHCFWTGLTEKMPRAFTPGTIQNRRSGGIAGSNFAWRKSFTLWRRGWRDGVETEREKLGGAAEWERGREAKTEGQVRVIFGRKCLPLEVFEINCVFAFPCSWDQCRDWQYVSSNMPTHCSPVLPAWPYSPNGVPLPRLGPAHIHAHTHAHTLRFTT